MGVGDGKLRSFNIYNRKIIQSRSIYIYEKAYFDFWEIPHVYINIDYRVVTFRFFETLIGVIIMLSIVCAGCLITQIAWKKVSPKGKFAKALFF